MIHIYKKGTNKNTLLLLHGTGGDESDLLEIGRIIDPEANVLSVRGNVKEGGMNRFFRRLSPGVFDLEDLEKRTQELYGFIDEASEKYGFDRDRVIALGYSNGANIAGSMLFSIKNALWGAILLRPMMPRRDKELVVNDNTKVFISAGTFDSICPPEESKELADHLKSKNKEVRLEWVNANHSLTYNELLVIRDWYIQNF
ncbi:MAG TPA: alpha/beta hydrolase [Acholeplasmataceae bacterium]|nr:alpha/beta hydrolase [Acholeplasmataceae bacterium]